MNGLLKPGGTFFGGPGADEEHIPNPLSSLQKISSSKPLSFLGKTRSSQRPPVDASSDNTETHIVYPTEGEDKQINSFFQNLRKRTSKQDSKKK